MTDRFVTTGIDVVEKLREYFVTEHEAESEADYFLAWLWIEGLKVVPLEAGDGEQDK